MFKLTTATERLTFQHLCEVAAYVMSKATIKHYEATELRDLDGRWYIEYKTLTDNGMAYFGEVEKVAA